MSAAADIILAAADITSADANIICRGLPTWYFSGRWHSIGIYKNRDARQNNLLQDFGTWVKLRNVLTQQIWGGVTAIEKRTCRHANTKHSFAYSADRHRNVDNDMIDDGVIDMTRICKWAGKSTRELLSNKSTIRETKRVFYVRCCRYKCFDTNFPCLSIQTRFACFGRARQRCATIASMLG